MTNEPAPIQRTLAVSAAAHIIIFGAAFAFALYGGGLLRHDREVMTVSLVSEDRSGGTPRRDTKRAKVMLSDPIRTDRIDETETERTLSPALSVNNLDQARVAQEHQEQEPAIEQGKGGMDEQGESVPEDPVGGSAAGQRFGYSSAEWQLLQASLERVKTYPRLARERGIEGTVLVRFRARPSGSIEQVDIVKSSGARILDEASITTVYRAAPVPYVDGWVEVPMVYRLRKAEEQ